MAKAIRFVSIERGYDPRDFTLVSFGGAGPLHACSLARALRIPRVLIPCMPGALSALGILMADVVRDYSRTVMMSADASLLEPFFAELEERGARELAEEGPGSASAFAPRTCATPARATNSTSLPGPTCSPAFTRRTGNVTATRTPRCVSRWSTSASASPRQQSRYAWPGRELRAGDGSQAILKTRALYFAGHWHESNVYDRDLLQPGDTFSRSGPGYRVQRHDCAPAGSNRLAWMSYANLVVEVN